MKCFRFVVTGSIAGVLAAVSCGGLALAQEPAPGGAAAPAPEPPPPAPPTAAEPTASDDPVPAAPGTIESNTTATAAPRKRGAPQVGLSPSTPQASSLVGAPAAEEEEAASDTPSDGEWRFDFHGYLRAPIRIGLGPGTPFGTEGDETKVHAPPHIPDGVFTNWRYTNNLPGPWVELRFVYGTETVSGNVSIGAYNITDGGYRNLQSQLGIDQAFVSMNFPDLFGDKGGLAWNVGVFQNRYGAAGRYDAGKYDTYLIGRNHTGGETLTLFYHLTDTLTLTFEHGIGAKLEAMPFVSGLPQPNPPYLPWSGPVEQGTQLVHHAHVSVSIAEQLHIGAHYMSTWTDDAQMGEVDGEINVVGFDVKLIDSRYGDGYIGFSHVDSETPLRLGDGFEIMHSVAGWSLRDNFFGQTSSGTGTIDSVMFQHVLSLARLLRYPEPFWGQGPDILLSIFGMYNHVSSDDEMFSGATDKLKWGAEATYIPLEFLGVSLRFDRVQPDLDDSTLAFSALSPKLLLRSQFVTHEQVVLQYTHYFYGDKVNPSYPAEALAPDEDAFMIAVTMWW